jgi:hypothetical protein
MAGFFVCIFKITTNHMRIISICLLTSFIILSCNPKPGIVQDNWKTLEIGNGWTIRLPEGYIDSSSSKVLRSPWSTIRFTYSMGEHGDPILAPKSGFDCSLAQQKRIAKDDIKYDETEFWGEENRSRKASVIVVDGKAAILKVPKKEAGDKLVIKIDACPKWEIFVDAGILSRAQEDTAIAIFKTLKLAK